ncbi:hypothetical protein FOA52_010942 [Chlamydomonas sp. UWO 241]|nr:hypothetical protein FOA52_010942 [Chlamydomonas sp. UWO 241]
MTRGHSSQLQRLVTVLSRTGRAAALLHTVRGGWRRERRAAVEPINPHTAAGGAQGVAVQSRRAEAPGRHGAVPGDVVAVAVAASGNGSDQMRHMGVVVREEWLFSLAELRRPVDMEPFLVT